MKLLIGNFSTRLNFLVLKDTKSNEIATLAISQLNSLVLKDTKSNEITNRQFLNQANSLVLRDT